MDEQKILKLAQAMVDGKRLAMADYKSVGQELLRLHEGSGRSVAPRGSALTPEARRKGNQSAIRSARLRAKEWQDAALAFAVAKWNKNVHIRSSEVAREFFDLHRSTLSLKNVQQVQRYLNKAQLFR